MQDGCKTLEELVERADGALYQAKENGRNRRGGLSLPLRS
jgi:PleD family two-component response regulator